MRDSRSDGAEATPILSGEDDCNVVPVRFRPRSLEQSPPEARISCGARGVVAERTASKRLPGSISLAAGSTRGLRQCRSRSSGATAVSAFSWIHAAQRGQARPEATPDQRS